LGGFWTFWGSFEPFGALLTGLGHYELFWGIWDSFGVTSKEQFGGSTSDFCVLKCSPN